MNSATARRLAEKAISMMTPHERHQILLCGGLDCLEDASEIGGMLRDELRAMGYAGFEFYAAADRVDEAIAYLLEATVTTEIKREGDFVFVLRGDMTVCFMADLFNSNDPSDVSCVRRHDDAATARRVFEIDTDN